MEPLGEVAQLELQVRQEEPELLARVVALDLQDNKVCRVSQVWLVTPDPKAVLARLASVVQQVKLASLEAKDSSADLVPVAILVLQDHQAD